VAGLVAAVLVFMALQDSDDSTTVVAPPDTVKAVVAAQNIAPGTEITEGMLETADVPEDLLVSGSFATSTPVVGEVTNVAIAKGEQVTRTKLGSAVPDKGLSGVLPPDMRGVAVQVEEVTAVGGNLLAGDRVDILVAHRIKNAPGLTEDEYILRTETVIQNVEVLSVAQEAQEPAAQFESEGESSEAKATSGEVPNDVDSQPTARSITFILTPAQVQEVISWQESEATQRVWAVLRAYGDDEVVEVEPIDRIIVQN
jgi:Flp pilus assembly protein CpaB